MSTDRAWTWYSARDAPRAMRVARRVAMCRHRRIQPSSAFATHRRFGDDGRRAQGVARARGRARVPRALARERARAERDDAHDSDAAELDSRPEMTDDEAAGHLGLEAPPKTRAEMQIAYRKRLLDVHPDKQALKPEGERLDAEEAKVQTRDALYARDFFLAEFRGDDDDDSGDE